MSEKKKIKIHSEPDEKEEDSGSDKTGTDNNQPKNLEPVTGEIEGVEPPDPMKELEAKLAAQEQEAKEINDRLLRVSADYENYKKRSAREMEDFRKYANQSLLKEMLTVVDNLELAINSAEEEKSTDEKLIEGLNLTRTEMLRVLEKFNVKPITARGEVFDPAFHEAVMREETDDYPENTVLSEFQKGYLIHDRLLRPAMVVVAASKSNEE